MKYYLIERIFKYLEKDKNKIIKSMSKFMDETILEVNDRYGKMILTIKYEKKVNN